MKALVYHYETWCISLAPWKCPEGAQNVLVMKSYNEIKKKCWYLLITFAYCQETYVDRFLGSCREHDTNYAIIVHTAILIFFENLLFLTPPRPLAWLSPNSTHLQPKAAWSYGFCVNGMMRNCIWGCISTNLWHVDIKIYVGHCHITLTIPHQFGNSTTYWSKVMNH